MDALPEPPPSFEQVVAQRLQRCGLSEHGIVVSYVDELQSLEVVITSEAGASPSMFDCIRQAVDTETVTFRDIAMMRLYHDYLTEALRPQTLARAESDLARRGLLRNFPRRADFADDDSFAGALESHCGVARGEAIRRSGEAFVFQPSQAFSNPNTWARRYSCLLSAILLASARNELAISLVGNDAFLAPD